MSAKVQPLAAGTYTVSSGFGARWGTTHYGQDYACALGTPLYAVADGVVVQGKDRAQGSVSGFGSWIWLDCQASIGQDIIYGHVDHGGILVQAGDRVTAGQIIGHSGNEGASTGPHCHVECWSAPGRLGGAAHDPAVFLADATEPGGALPAQGGQMSTLYGIDVSEFQDGLNLSGTGMDFVIIRLAYGASKADRCAVSHTQDWATTGKPVSFYHYLTPWDSIDSQADLVKRMWDACGQRGGVWIDVEEPGITRSQVVGFRDALRSRGVLVIGAYSRANFWEALPGGEPTAAEGGGAIWVSHYGQQPAGPIRSIYPGDSSSQWSYPLGNRKPDLWQWTDRATVPGWTSGVDANAYRGSVDQLRALFTGGEAATTSEEDDMFTDDDHAALLDCRAMLQTLCAQDMGDATITGPFGGWPQTGYRTRTDTLAAIAHKLGVPGTTDTKEK
jgi:GH25 family lysozyme M1 (1,4-beta-N-acetylmuramidase)